MPSGLSTAFIGAGAVWLPASPLAGGIIASVGLVNELLSRYAAFVQRSAEDQTTAASVVDTGVPTDA